MAEKKPKAPKPLKRGTVMQHVPTGERVLIIQRYGPGVLDAWYTVRRPDGRRRSVPLTQLAPWV
jgi:hypothetical protein